MTSDDIGYFVLIGGVLCLIVPSWELAVHKEGKKGLRKITPIGWILFCIAVYIFTFSAIQNHLIVTEKVISDSIANKQRIIDKNEIIKSFQDALKEKNLSYDPSKNKVDTLVISRSYLEKALLTVVQQQYSFLRGKTYNISIRVQNFNKGVAINLSDNILHLSNDGGWHILNTFHNITNESVFLPQNAIYDYDIECEEPPNRKVNYFYYFKLNYSTKNSSGITTLRCVGVIPPFKEKNGVIHDPSADLYNEIKSFLQSKDLW